MRSWMRTVFEAYRANGSATAADLAASCKPEFRKVLQAPGIPAGPLRL